MENQIDKPDLMVHEWLSIVFIIGFLGVLTFISLASKNFSRQLDTAHPHYLSDPYIEVNIEGAVKNPGKIRVERGATLGQVLEQAILLPEADIKRLNLDSKVRRNKVIKIPQKPLITIHLKGAVEAQMLQVPKGSQLQDLLHQVKFKEGADLRKLKRRRRLKEGETIFVPFYIPVSN